MKIALVALEDIAPILEKHDEGVIKRREYRALHKEEIKVAFHIYYEKMKDVIKGKRKGWWKKWYASHRDFVVKKKRVKYYANHEENKKESRESAAKNRVVINLRSRIAKHNKFLIAGEREKQREKDNLRYATDFKKKERNQLRVLLTQDLIDKIYSRNIKPTGSMSCCCCKKCIAKGEENLEHNVCIPRLKEFPKVEYHSLENLDFAHWHCNFIKGKRILSECKMEEFLSYEKLLKGRKVLI